MKLFKLLKKNMILILVILVIIAVIYVLSNKKEGFQSYTADGLTPADIVNAGFDDPRYTYQCPTGSPYSMLIVKSEGQEADVNYLNMSRCVKPCNSYSQCANNQCSTDDSDGTYCIKQSDLDLYNACDNGEENAAYDDGTCIYRNISLIQGDNATGYRFYDDYIIPDAFTVEGFKVDSFTNKKKRKANPQPPKCVCPPNHKTDGKKCYRPINLSNGEILIKLKKNLYSITKYKKSERVWDNKKRKMVTKTVTRNIESTNCLRK